MTGGAAREVRQAVIRDHFRRPRNRGRLEGACATGRADNPACGDTVKVWVRVQDGKVAEAAFDGSGCLLSQAAASMTTMAVQGKTVDAVAQLRREVAEGLRRGGPGLPPEAADLRALEGVDRFPNRVRCAVLALDAFAEALATREP